jgi:hemerythrin-like domain-containing protein
MCEYCGCQEIDVIAELTAEHDELRNLGHELGQAANAGDLAAARPLAARMRDLLGPHTAVEERGLFPSMHDEYGDQLDALVQEHREIDAAFTDLAAEAPGASWRSATQLALAHLFDHILKEQDGVFPAALATLTSQDWEAIGTIRGSVGSALVAPK